MGAVAHFPAHQFADVLQQIVSVPRGTLTAAALCAMGAFATLARYEIVVVRYVKHCIGRAKPVMTALIAFPLGHAIGQAMLSGGALRYRMYTPAGFSAIEVGATVLLANLPYALAFGLLLDISLVVAAETLEPMFRMSSDVVAHARLHRSRQGRRDTCCSWRCAKKPCGSAAGT